MCHYNLQVAMQRTMLLAAICFSHAQKQRPKAWSQLYTELLMGVKGENICTQAGRKLAQEMAEKLKKQHCPLEVTIGKDVPESMMICVTNAEALYTVTRVSDNCCQAGYVVCAAPLRHKQHNLQICPPGRCVFITLATMLLIILPHHMYRCKALVLK